LAQSWIEVELDLTPPTVEIFAPSIIISQSFETITIEANENLDIQHSIYIIDSLGTRHDYTFHLETERKLVNTISFENIPKGLTTLFVIVYDEVLNKSSIYKKNINVGNVQIEDIENVKLNLELNEKENELIINERINELNLNERIAEIIDTLN
jgi:hypothetical protein